MKIWQHENIVYCVHPVDSKASEHGHLVKEARKLLDHALKSYPKVVAYHDLSNSKSADNAYLELWAEIGKEYKDRAYYLCVVTSAWMRTLVKTVSFIGRLDIHVVKSHDEAKAKLAEQGFVVRLESAPV